ncbi:hypothetical protein [Salinibacterium sp. PAMC 21357]|uniref:hypothetical protein n=1 Tax=Salinibacterium sp. PAMC 21357 TaxID=1112215 RepID=UPI00028A04DF|nr:hypothetical protein [Salinibacterium sp. PAMC 21357]
MNTDLNLLNVKRVLDLAAILSWVLLGVAVLGLLGYVVISGLTGTAFAARVPIIIGFIGVTISAILQVIFANAAPKAFPAERRLRLKALLGIAAPGVLAFIVAAISSLGVQVIAGVRDAFGSDVLFVLVVLVCAPLTGFLFDAGRKMSVVEKKYGVDGAVQLYDSQHESALLPR